MVKKAKTRKKRTAKKSKTAVKKPKAKKPAKKKPKTTKKPTQKRVLRKKVPVSPQKKKETKKVHKAAKKKVKELEKKVKKAKGKEKQKLEVALDVAKRQAKAYGRESYRAQTQHYWYPGIFGPPFGTEGELHNYPAHQGDVILSLNMMKMDIDFVEETTNKEVDPFDFVQKRLDQAELDWSFANKAFNEGRISIETFQETEKEFRKVQKLAKKKKKELSK